MAIAVKAGTLACSFIFAALLSVAMSGCNQDQSNWVGITSGARSTPGSVSSTVAAPSNVNGSCGSSNRVAVSSAPTRRFCSAGTASAVGGTGPWSWMCAGSNGGSTAQCSAPPPGSVSSTVAAPSNVNGSCGSSNRVAISSAPTTGLCSAGTASAVGGAGPWSWMCAGSNGSSTAQCSAPHSTLYPVSQFATRQPPLITLSRPAYLQPMALPGMGTSVMRISDAGTFGIGQRYYRHYYSKTQPWNSDSTRLMLSIDPHRVYFLDGKTFAYLWTATNVPDYTKWSNSDPDLMYGTLYQAGAVVKYTPSTGAVQILKTFSGFTSLYLGMNSGNLSNDDRYIPLVGEYATGFTVIIYDAINNVEVGRKDFPGVPVANWVSMSQSGQYVVVGINDSATGVSYYDVYDTQMNYLRRLNAYAGGHADLGYDSTGNEVLVYGQYVGGKGVLLMSIRLADNTVQQQLPGISAPAGIYMASNYHISCRNINRPGYCYVSNFAFGYALDAYMFHEVFGLKLDGSGSVERFSQDFAAPLPLADIPYFRMSMVVPNRDGSLVLFSSDWGDPSSTAIIYDYVAGVVELN
jgi:hypothetical protein